MIQITIKIKAFQKKGIKTEQCIDKFEFCCWTDLKLWLEKFKLHSCPECKKKEE